MGLEVRWILYFGEITSSFPLRDMLSLTSGTHTVWGHCCSQLASDKDGGGDAVYLGGADYAEQGRHTSLTSMTSHTYTYTRLTISRDLTLPPDGLLSTSSCIVIVSVTLCSLLYPLHTIMFFVTQILDRTVADTVEMEKQRGHG